MSAIEYLMRVRPAPNGFSATLRQFAQTSHPEVRAVIGPIATGSGATAPAAMVAAVVAAHLPELPAAVRESHYGC
jgi:hypothetical protein